MLDAQQIQEIIPHRYPFLLVDRIIDVEFGKHATGIKNVSMGDHFFQGHFPDYPVMPGVLIVEALAQVGSVALLGHEDYAGMMGFFAGINKVRFRRQVVPGDTLTLEIEVLKMRRSIGTASAKASVDGEVACSGELMFAVVDPATFE